MNLVNSQEFSIINTILYKNLKQFQNHYYEILTSLVFIFKFLK